MTWSSLDPSRGHDRPRSAEPDETPPDGATCELYAPGHQMHYRHQGNAVRSRSERVEETVFDGIDLNLLLDSRRELHWRHHDAQRLRRILELVPGTRVAYPDFHALRVGPYWFNCASEVDDWQDCPLAAASRRT